MIKQGVFMKKKKIAIMLLFFLVLSFAAGCSPQENTLMDFITESDVPDLDGYEFTFETYWMGQYYPDSADTTDWGEKQLKRYKDIGEKYNCTITGIYLDDYGSGGIKEFLVKLLAAGRNIPELIDAHANEVYDYYKTGLLACLDDVSTLDMTDEEKWGPTNFRRYGVFGGRNYGFFSYEWTTMPEVAGTLLYNCQLAKQRGFTYDVHELKEQGEWTWEKFEEILTSMQNIGDADIVPLGIREEEEPCLFAEAAVYSNGGQVVKQDESGKYVFALGDSNAMAALEWVGKLRDAGLIQYDLKTVDFVAGKSFFLACESYVGTHTDSWMAGTYPAANMTDYTYINMPTGPNAGTDQIASFTHSHRRLFWMTEDAELDHEITGMIVNDIFEPLDDLESEAWKAMSKRFMFFYEAGYEEYIKSVEQCSYDYTTQLGDVADTLKDALEQIIVKGKSAVETIQSITPAVTAKLDEELNSGN